MRLKKETPPPGSTRQSGSRGITSTRDHMPVGIIGGDKVDGDKITMGEVDGTSAVAVGRGAKASIFNIDIRLLPLVIGLGVLVTVLAYFQFKPEQKPVAMDPGFNVAVAEFMVEDTNGSQITSGEGLQFSKWLYERVESGLNQELKEFTDTFHIWPPENTGVITGADEKERAGAAAARAKEIGADILIYGVLQQDEAKSDTTIEFYVNHDSFDEAEDIKGPHVFGGALRIKNPFKEGLDELGNLPLKERAKSLSLLAIGLAYYSIDDFDQAITYLSLADGENEWYEKAEGKHVVKLLLGNAYLRKSSIEKDAQLVPTARVYYSQALELDSEYARAIMGMANVDLMLALGDPNDHETQIDLKRLKNAEAGYKNALAYKNENDVVNVQSKVDYGLGNVYLLRYQLEGGDWLDQAYERFAAVAAAYESGNTDIKDMAAHAYARMGFIADVYRGNTANAIAHYEKATKLASPFYEGLYLSILGDRYVEACQLDLAEEAYGDAIQVAKRMDQREQVAAYRDKQAMLQDVDSCA